MNRGLSSHLAPRGTVHDQETPIGNPKFEFLPKNRDRIEAELRGMIERWKAAGQPLDEGVKHSMTPWAQCIGGILRLGGFRNFLGNVSSRKAADDPVQEALAILGVAKPGKALRPSEWAKTIVDEGLVKTLIPPNQRDTEKSRTRAAGVILKNISITRSLVVPTRRSSIFAWRVGASDGTKVRPPPMSAMSSRSSRRNRYRLMTTWPPKLKAALLSLRDNSASLTWHAPALANEGQNDSKSQKRKRSIRPF